MSETNFLERLHSSESKCHFRGVTFCCVPGVLPLNKRKGTLLSPRAFRGVFRKMTLVFPCFAVYATYEQVSLSHGFQPHSVSSLGSGGQAHWLSAPKSQRFLRSAIAMPIADPRKQRRIAILGCDGKSLAICDFGLRFLSPKRLLRCAGFLAIWLRQRGNR